MKNRLFDQPQVERLWRPEAWKIVESRVTPAADLADDGALSWHQANQSRHDRVEALLTLGGQADFCLAGRLHRCPPATFVFIDAGEAHDNEYPPTADRLHHLWLYFLDSGVCGFTVRVHRQKITYDENARFSLSWDELGLNWRQFVTRYRHSRSAAEARAGLLALLALVNVAMVERGFQPQRQENTAAFQQQVIQTICRHIRDGTGQDTSLAGLARLAGYSPCHFAKLFHRHTGQTVLAYVNQHRREQMLAWRATGRPYKQIAADLGFSCPAAFSRWRRQHA